MRACPKYLILLVSIVVSLYKLETWFFLDFPRIWVMDNLFSSERKKGKKCCPLLKNNLSGSEKGLCGGLRGSFKTKFVSLNNRRINKNQGKMRKISVKKLGKVRKFFS